MICQQCSHEHKIQFLICPECHAYQFKQPQTLVTLLTSAIMAGVIFGLTYLVGDSSDTSREWLKIVNEHWINSIILFTSYWGGFLVLSKYLDYRKQKKAHTVFLEPKIMDILSAPNGMNPKNFHKIIHEIRNELLANNCPYVTDYITFDLIRKTMYHLESVQQKEEINSILEYHAQIGRTKLEEDFTMLKVLYWAIPILGFIGTVLGIGSAIGHFSSFISADADAAGLKASLVSVSEGLAIAFDSTLLALSFAVILLPFGSMVENLYENLITQGEEYALSFITPNMRFPIDPDSPEGVFNMNVKNLANQTSLMQEFMSDFTNVCHNLLKGEQASPPYESGQMIATPPDMVNEEVENSDALATEALLTVEGTDVIEFEDDKTDEAFVEEEVGGQTLLESLISERDDQTPDENSESKT